jgi:hypothetical protein
MLTVDAVRLRCCYDRLGGHAGRGGDGKGICDVLGVLTERGERLADLAERLRMHPHWERDAEFAVVRRLKDLMLQSVDDIYAIGRNKNEPIIFRSSRNTYPGDYYVVDGNHRTLALILKGERQVTCDEVLEG